MIFNNLTFKTQSSEESSMSSESSSSAESNSEGHSSPSEKKWDDNRKKLRSASTEVSSINMMTIISKAFVHHPRREC